MQRLQVWEKELVDDPDSGFLLQGILYGFNIIDSYNVADIPYAESDNYRSATCEQFRDRVEAQIMDELLEGNYIIVQVKPRIISALGAVPKSSGSVRIIMDGSRPILSGLNHYATVDHFKYQSVQDAINCIGPGWFQCKVDLRSAYRVCHINPDHQPLCGFKWRFKGDSQYTYMVDTRLSFGARKSPEIFHRLTQSVRRMMKKRGFYNIVVFLDDFYICAKSEDECRHVYNVLISLLRNLGFHINWNKLVEPTQQLVFLGVNINTVSGTLWIDNSKVSDLKSLLQDMLHKKRVSRGRLESLAGKLSWVSNVIPWGRLHIRAIYNAIRFVKERYHKVKIQPEIYADLKWWYAVLDLGINRRQIWDRRPIYYIYTDSSNLAGGAFFQGLWLYRVWHIDRPAYKHLHINIKELLMVGEAISQWADILSGHRVFVFTDNLSAAYIASNGTSKHPAAMSVLRDIGFNALKFNFSLHTFYIPGRCNDIADAISRLHSAGQIQRLFSLLRERRLATVGFWLPNHMTLNSMYFIFPQVRKWVNLLQHWMKRSLPGGVMPSLHPLSQSTGLSWQPISSSVSRYDVHRYRHLPTIFADMRPTSAGRVPLTPSSSI